METEKFELMLDEAQANAALEKGMLYADTFVNKNYLINLDRYPLVELDPAEKSDEYIRLYQIERIVYDVDENANDKLISVYSAFFNIQAAGLLVIKSTRNALGFYIGVRSVDNTSTAEAILEKSFKGNFAGSQIQAIPQEEVQKVLGSINKSGRFGTRQNVSSVSIVPSTRDEDKERFVQGIEKFIDTMKGSEYTAVFIAEPLDKEILEQRKRGLQKIYSGLSPFASTQKGEVIMAQPQPAKVSYFFGKGYSDLWNTIKESWSRNIHSAGDQFSLACEKGCFTMGGGMNLIAAISIFTFGSLITAFTTFAHIAVLFAFFAFIYMGFGLLWLIDRIYIMINKIKNACPNPDCQASFLIPTYECPGCGEKHTNLVPSKYGILKRTCLCGTKLPTTFLNGRGQLKAYCPECDTALSGDTASRQYAFPVIGGPSVGKTCFINMAIDQMMSDVAPARSWKMSFISDTEEKDHALAMKSLNQGVRLMKTELNSLTAYQLMLKLPNEKIGRRIYVYDISGEMFSSSSDVQNNLAYSYANGFIFIIDPLTLNQFAMDVEDKVDLNAYGASSKDFDDILNIMLINLEKMFGLKDKDTLKRNLAVVINKVDIPTLEEKIGETAAQQYLAENAKTCKSYMDARDAVCRNFLEEYGAGNFVRTAEAKFKTVRYFTCSALGHNHEGQPYEGKNVVDPVMWLLQQADSSIKAE